MVSSVSIDKQNQTAASGETFPLANNARSDMGVNSKEAISSIIEKPREANFVRNLLIWKTPLLGYVRMYINPQQMTVSSKKNYQTSRTKAGFVYQYAGEDMTRISLQGTTGSSGMEGINVLNAVYRSEQAAFNGVAESIEQKLQATQVSNFLQASASIFSGNSGIGQIIDVAMDAANAAITDIFNQPFPTLASLAANIELSFQGITYRGFFESFSVSESAASPGLFDYTIEFTSYANRGVRRNFMPWHKQPYGPADSNGPNPLSYYTNYEFGGGVPNSPTVSRQNGPTATATFKNETSTTNSQVIANIRPPALPSAEFNEFVSNVKNLSTTIKRDTQIAASKGKSSINSLI